MGQKIQHKNRNNISAITENAQQKNIIIHRDATSIGLIYSLCICKINKLFRKIRAKNSDKEIFRSSTDGSATIESAKFGIISKIDKKFKIFDCIVFVTAFPPLIIHKKI